MKKQWFLVAFLALGLSLFLTVGADRAAAQGPAGAGAAGATTQSSHSSHSLNPIKWVKKDKSSTDANASRSEIEKKLTPKLQARGLLAANANATDACAPFTALNECVAALHASHNLGLDFNCLRAVSFEGHNDRNDLETNAQPSARDGCVCRRGNRRRCGSSGRSRRARRG